VSFLYLSFFYFIAYAHSTGPSLFENGLKCCGSEILQQIHPRPSPKSSQNNEKTNPKSGKIGKQIDTNVVGGGFGGSFGAVSASGRFLDDGGKFWEPLWPNIAPKAGFRE